MAYEDFTTFTRVDYENFNLFTEVDGGNDITVDSDTKVSWVNLLSNNEAGYVYKDKGAGHFDGDYDHLFEIQWSNTSGTAHTQHWLLATHAGTRQNLEDNSGDGVGLQIASGRHLYLLVWEAGTITPNDGADFLALAGTTLYINTTRDDDAGANNTGQFVTYVRTGSHAGVLQDTFTCDASAGEQNDYRYLHCVATRDDNSGANDIDGFTQNLDINEYVTVESSTKVSWLNLQRRLRTTYTYKDYGVAYFSGDFEHQYEIEFGAVDNNGVTRQYIIASDFGDKYMIDDVAAGDGTALRVRDNSEALFLDLFEAGSSSSDVWPQPGPQIDTTYYITHARDDDAGANNTGQYTLYIRTGSHTGTLQDTLTLDAAVGEQNDFRYINVSCGDHDSANASRGGTGFIQNLDLQEAVAGGAPTGALYGPLVGPLGGPI